jgi:hypothetical protein
MGQVPAEVEPQLRGSCIDHGNDLNVLFVI